MKRLSSLLTLLLWPAFASAVCLPPANYCVATSGTAIQDASGVLNPFHFAGNGFSASGAFEPFNTVSSVGHPFAPGDVYQADLGGGFPGNLLVDFELTINGVPWGIPDGGFAELNFGGQDTRIYSSGQFSVPFSLQGLFQGAPEPFAPGVSCEVLKCEILSFAGVGTVTIDVADFEDSSLIGVKETYTFPGVKAPEPATLSLFAVGLVGLAMRRKAVAALRVS